VVPLGTKRGEESLIGARIARPLHAILRPLGKIESSTQDFERPTHAIKPEAPTPLQQPRPDVTGAIAAIGEAKPAREEPSRPPDPTLRSGNPTAGVVPLPDDYLDAKDLSELPRPLSDPQLAEIERIVSRAGEVRMVLFIDESGKVVAVDVRSSTLPADAVARAVSIFGEVPFSPGRVGALAVKSRLGITVGAARRGSYGN
jgi:hypothetical protein